MIEGGCHWLSKKEKMGNGSKVVLTYAMTNTGVVVDDDGDNDDNDDDESKFDDFNDDDNADDRAFDNDLIDLNTPRQFY